MTDERETVEAECKRLQEEVERLTNWINDLQSGMYVNCVYCGHQYGPGETTPVSMADALKEHIAQCPKHPMSRLTSQLEEARGHIRKLRSLVRIKWGNLDKSVNKILEEVDDYLFGSE